jgi:hypothetical protein
MKTAMDVTFLVINILFIIILLYFIALGIQKNYQNWKKNKK